MDYSEMRFAETSLESFFAELSEKSSVPGGGGAAAAAGAMGAALAGMVANFTLGKKKYARYEDDIAAIIAKSGELRERFTALIDGDAAAFEPLSRAYSIPKDNPERAAILESCLRAAAAVPMEITRLACETVSLHAELLDKGSAMLQSDVGCGVALCRSAICSAALNVKANTELMRDRDYAEKLDRETEELINEYIPEADRIYNTVTSRAKK